MGEADAKIIFKVGDLISIHDPSDRMAIRGEATVIAATGDTIFLDAPVESMRPGDIIDLVPQWVLDMRKGLDIPYYCTAPKPNNQ